MTIAAARWPRRLRFAREPGEPRLFETEPGVRVLAHCHWQADRRHRPTLLLLHGLEGSSESHYILGTAEKAFFLGMNVVRVNQRNCGGSLLLAPTLYDSGLSSDPIAVLSELSHVDGLSPLLMAGWSMGGNIVLKAAAELGQQQKNLLAGVCVVSPALDLGPCVSALESGFNRIYEKWFLQSLKNKLRRKSMLFPELYDRRHLRYIDRLREFDELYTAPAGGYGNAESYYKNASALPFMDQISVPTLLIQSRDDPFIPFQSFLSPQLRSPSVNLLATDYGGHCGFLHRHEERSPLADRFWAENRLVTFLAATAERRADK